jgi:UV DNA damage endonuclease
MHPDQFVVINSPNPQTVQNSIAELQYHTDMFRLMGLGKDHKLQIHVGGVYGDKTESIKRFIENYKKLPQEIKERLAIEDDDRLFSVDDCYRIYEEVGIPIIFDNFHYSLNNNGEDLLSAMKKSFSTWKECDGIPMIDYSSQQQGDRKGRHSDEIDIVEFKNFYDTTRPLDFDIMLEIKDKDISALKALEVVGYEAFIDSVY